MYISNLCIRRPVFSTVLSLILVLVGIISLRSLDVRSTPDIDPPIINVSANYWGANASYMEKQVTIPIEKILRTVKNVDNISSETSQGSSNVRIIFKLDTDIDKSLNDIKSKISSINDSFPQDMRMPTAEKLDSDAWPVLWMAIRSSKFSDMALTNIVYQDIVKPLEQLSSVGRVRIFGARYYTMSIMPDPNAVRNFGLSISDLENAIKSQNADYPAGVIKTNAQEYVLQLKGKLSTEEEFRNITIKSTENGLIKLGQVAKIKLEPYDENVILRYNGKPGMAVGVVKQSKANVIDVSDQISDILPDLQKELAKQDINIEIAYNGADTVKASIKSVFFTIFEALILVTFITYLFLRSIKITLIPFVTIPISLITTFAFMNLLGFSINNFTMLAMILAIGLVVDDAIVMLENIYRHFEKGKDIFTAAIDGSKETGFAILAMTITLASVFIPIGFISGFIGKLFIEFAWTLAFCVLVSGFVSLTLTPMMCSKMINKDNIGNNILIDFFTKKLDLIEDKYKQCLNVYFDNNRIFYSTISILIIVLITSFVFVNKQFSPPEDNSILYLNATGPEGSSLDHSSKSMLKAENILSENKNIAKHFTVIGNQGSSRGFGFVMLKNLQDRNNTNIEAQNQLNQSLSQIPSMSIAAFSPPGMSGGGNADVEFYIHGKSGSNATWEIFDNASDKIVEMMKQSPIFNNIQRTLASNVPSVNIEINRDKAYKQGINMSEVGSNLQALIAGKKVGDFSIENDIYEVTMRYSDKNKNKIADLDKIFIRNKHNKMINLSSIADIKEEVSIRSYEHYNGQKSVTVSAGLNEGYKVADAVSFIDDMMTKVEDSYADISFNYLGEIKRMNESSNDLLFTFILALIFIYLVLSAQFESFIDPLIILCAVPFSIAGGIVSLILGFDSVNLYSGIGLITLLGLITKNSIMIVEFANQLVSKGMDTMSAVKESANLRLRPILMTTFATIFGAIPLLIASNQGFEARNSIGLVIVGGMAIGTIFSTLIIPVIYYKVKKW